MLKKSFALLLLFTVGTFASTKATLAQDKEPAKEEQKKDPIAGVWALEFSDGSKEYRGIIHLKASGEIELANDTSEIFGNGDSDATVYSGTYYTLDSAKSKRPYGKAFTDVSLNGSTLTMETPFGPAEVTLGKSKATGTWTRRNKKGNLQDNPAGNWMMWKAEKPVKGRENVFFSDHPNGAFGVKVDADGKPTMAALEYKDKTGMVLEISSKGKETCKYQSPNPMVKK